MLLICHTFGYAQRLFSFGLFFILFYNSNLRAHLSTVRYEKPIDNDLDLRLYLLKYVVEFAIKYHYSFVNNALRELGRLRSHMLTSENSHIMIRTQKKH